MADILIRGIKKPERCFICPLKYNRGMNYYCTIKEMQGVDSCISKNTMSVVCPFSELPPHGDLIDRDALLAEYERDERAADEHGREFSFSFDSGGARCTEWWIVQQKLMDAPVIIPTGKGE